MVLMVIDHLKTECLDRRFDYRCLLSAVFLFSEWASRAQKQQVSVYACMRITEIIAAFFGALVCFT